LVYIDCSIGSDMGIVTARCSQRVGIY